MDAASFPAPARQLADLRAAAGKAKDIHSEEIPQAPSACISGQLDVRILERQFASELSTKDKWGCNKG
eukprot:10057612-Alexandrium_andersonii.AAC.1